MGTLVVVASYFIAAALGVILGEWVYDKIEEMRRKRG